MQEYNELLTWWNTCGLELGDKITMLLLWVKDGNKAAIELMNELDLSKAQGKW